MNSKQPLKERIFSVKGRLQIRNKEELAKRLGCSRPMLYLYETGQNEPPTEFLRKLAELEAEAGVRQTTSGDVKLLNSAANLSNQSAPMISDEGGFYRTSTSCKVIPIVGWAHAGNPFNYEELPESWREEISTHCRDNNAYAVRIEGDSMEPRFYDDDILVVMPSEAPHSGCFAVCKFADGGVSFRRVEIELDTVRLIPLNVRYQITEHAKEDFEWIYPVFERRTLLWKA
ncbi:helix-turn-helix domain-containing protein [Rubritalea spongiae]|uniref:Helix-turn-helix domain-containing protein n=1 Tax=Rubritalea spongiae TaxID=430797 RepID=A0ABW5DYP2_9BACT